VAPLSIPNKNIFSDRQNLLCEVFLFRVRWTTVPQSRSSSCKSSIVEGVHITTYNACSALCGTYSRRWWTSAKRRRSLAGTVTTMVKCQTATDERASQPWSRRSGVPVASVADGATALCVWTSSTRNQIGGGVLNRLQPVQPRTQSCSSPGNRRRTPIPVFYSHLQTVIDWLIEQGLTSPPTQYRLYGRRFFTVRKTQPTVSKYWRDT